MKLARAIDITPPYSLSPRRATTGLVGRNALSQVLARPEITQVIAPTRKPLPKDDRLSNPGSPKVGTAFARDAGPTTRRRNFCIGHNHQKGRDRKRPFIRLTMVCLSRSRRKQGDRGEFRFGESIALTLSRYLAPVLPKRFHVNPASKIAQALVDAILTGEPGFHFRYSDSLV